VGEEEGVGEQQQQQEQLQLTGGVEERGVRWRGASSNSSSNSRVGGWGEGGQPRIRQGLLGVQANKLQAVLVPPVVEPLHTLQGFDYRSSRSSESTLFATIKL